ncbi:MAG: MFS transporter [Gammaproteobacteria bacterium]|nr:MFS transporter [Gammaproteobacteria bacterium]
MMQENVGVVERPSLLQSWVVVLSSAFFFFYTFIQMNMFNAINPSLLSEFHFTGQQIGELAAFYFYGNVAFLFPAGIILDRLSIKRILLFAFAVAAIAAYIFSISSSFWAMCFARLAIGAVGSFSILSCIKLASRWFEPKYMALVVGVVVTMAMLGGMIAQTPMTLLTNAIGWRYALQVGAALGVVLMIIILAFVKDFPAGLSKSANVSAEQLGQIGFWNSLGLALKNPQNWLSGIYISFVNLPLFVLGAVWGSMYLTQIHHLSTIEAANANSMIYIGLMIGSPLAGWISGKMGLRKMPMVIGGVLSLIAVLVVIFTPTLPAAGWLFLYFLLGLIIGAQVIGYPVINESNPSAITATATGIGSTLIMAGGALMPIFGWLLDLSGDKTMVNNVPVYSTQDFRTAMMMMVVGMVIAIIASFLIKETYCGMKK